MPTGPKSEIKPHPISRLKVELTLSKTIWIPKVTWNNQNIYTFTNMIERASSTVWFLNISIQHYYRNVFCSKTMKLRNTKFTKVIKSSSRVIKWSYLQAHATNTRTSTNMTKPQTDMITISFKLIPVGSVHAAPFHPDLHPRGQDPFCEQ